MQELIENSYAIYIISFIAFVAVILLIEAFYFLFRSLDFESANKVSRRLRTLSAGGMDTREALSLLNARHLSNLNWLNNVLGNIPRMHALDRSLEQAGMDITVTRYLLIQFLLVMTGWIILSPLLKLNSYIAIPLAVVIGVGIPWLVVGTKQRRRKILFGSQLPDTLEYLARSLRAGNPLSAALRSAGEEMPEPTAFEFRTTFEELNFGLDLETAMHNLAERTACEEIRYFITAVLIQRQTGGNLAEVLTKIAKVMRARMSTKREIQVLAAEMNYSAKVLIFLPFFVAFIMMIVNPMYLTVLFEHELGMVIIGLQILFMAIGYAIIQKMIHFRV